MTTEQFDAITEILKSPKREIFLDSFRACNPQLNEQMALVEVTLLEDYARRNLHNPNVSQELYKTQITDNLPAMHASLLETLFRSKSLVIPPQHLSLFLP